LYISIAIIIIELTVKLKSRCVTVVGSTNYPFLL